MRATDHSSVHSTAKPNQNNDSTETTPKFIYLYDKEIDPNSVKFCTRIAKLSTQAAELLIQYGADITYIDDGDTPLTLAVSKGQLSVVSCILQHSTDHNTGLSAQLVQQARTAGREDIALVLDKALESLPVWKH